jgi:hypothetical protein
MDRPPIRLSAKADAIFSFCLLAFCAMSLAFNSIGDAATYYLDANVVGGNDDGTSWENAWKTITKAFAYLDSLSDNGSGDTLIVRTGNYGNHWDREERTDWLTIQADDGHTPNFTHFNIGLTNDPVRNTYLYFKDITIKIDDSDNHSDTCVSIIRSRYVKFENVTFIGMAFPGEGNTDYYDWLHGGSYGINILRGCKYITIDGCSFTGLENAIYSRDKEGSGNSTDRVESVTITDCNITKCDTAVHAWGHDFAIINNHVHNMYGDGFKVLCENIDINDNHIEGVWNYVYFVDETGATYNNDTKVITASAGTPYTFPEHATTSARITVDGVTSNFKAIDSHTTSTITMDMAFGASFTGTVTKIEINDGGHADAIQIMWDSSPDHVVTKNAVIARNHIHDQIHQGIYSNTDSENPTTGLVLENNLIYDCGAHEVQIFNSIDVVLRNNTVDGHVIFRNGTVATEVSNNIFYNFTDYSSHHVTPEQVTIDNFDYNILNQCYFASLPSSNNIKYNNENSFQALFTDYDNKDYTLASDSIAINRSVSSKSSSTDILGNPRDAEPDAGCYEYIQGTPSLGKTQNLLL